MALKAGRVGVNPSQVDMAGNVIGSGDTYTKLEIDQLLGSKVGIGQLEANNKDFYFAYDETSQKYGYKLDNTGDFHPFEEGGSAVPGWNRPDGLSATGLIPDSNITILNGGYVNIDGVCYIDIVYQKEGSSVGNIDGFPATDYYASASIPMYNCLTAQSDIDDYFINCNIIGSANFTTAGKLQDGISGGYRRVISQFKIKTT